MKFPIEIITVVKDLPLTVQPVVVNGYGEVELHIQYLQNIDIPVNVKLINVSLN